MKQNDSVPVRTGIEQRLSLFAEPEKHIALDTVALVVGPYETRKSSGKKMNVRFVRSTNARLEEIRGLALAIDLKVVETLYVPLGDIRPATYIGKGKVEEISNFVKSHSVQLVIMDCALSPIQQRNLEKEFQTKVIDRTGLILEIFGRRAHTKEGLLQVEHAHLAYQKSRLVRSWTHLERQRGGYGFLGGPGETQIESDRRMIQERMGRIERELEVVKRTRALHRAGRKRIPFPVIAFVGYTNAGKSTLFNKLSAASVLAEDMLFATLDPTSRAVKLPHGETVIVSDTVGFISELPTMLVAAFRATLEDVITADILLHVRDISDQETDAQAEDVRKVLRDIDIDPSDSQKVIEIWNKADCLSLEEKQKLEMQIARWPYPEKPILLSALTGEGAETLLEEIERRLSLEKRVFEVHISLEDGQSSAWLHEHTEVLSRTVKDDSYFVFEIRVTQKRSGEFLKRFPDAVQVFKQLDE